MYWVYAALELYAFQNIPNNPDQHFLSTTQEVPCTGCCPPLTLPSAFIFTLSHVVTKSDT